MTTSNSTDYNETRDQIITDALYNLAVYRPGATIASKDINLCNNELNKIVKALVGKGIGVWKETEGTLFLRVGVNRYTIGGSSSDKAGDDTISTTLTSGTGTSLTVADTTGMTAGDNVGIELDDNTRQWTTITSVNNSTSLTITTGLTSTASSGNTIFTYTTASTKPIYVSGTRFRANNGTEIVTTIQGREEFMTTPNKDTQSAYVNQVFYTAQLLSGLMYVYPTPDNCAGSLKFSYQRVFNDFDAAGDTPDFPAEWLECLTLLLMDRVSRAYGKSAEERQDIKADAHRALNDMQLWDVNGGSSFIVPAARDE